MPDAIQPGDEITLVQQKDYGRARMARGVTKYGTWGIILINLAKGDPDQVLFMPVIGGPDGDAEYYSRLGFAQLSAWLTEAFKTQN